MRGSYLLLMELKNDKKISVGKLGEIKFNKGIYVYVGSALNGLDQRIQRHLRKNKKIHWHIDYLLKYTDLVDVFYTESMVRKECTIANELEKELLSVQDFGCSDCRCESHLFYGPYKPIVNIIDKLNMEKYLINAKS